jgi:hypothetical protein
MSSSQTAHSSQRVSLPIVFGNKRNRLRVRVMPELGRSNFTRTPFSSVFPVLYELGGLVIKKKAHANLGIYFLDRAKINFTVKPLYRSWHDVSMILCVLHRQPNYPVLPGERHAVGAERLPGQWLDHKPYVRAASEVYSLTYSAQCRNLTNYVPTHIAAKNCHVQNVPTVVPNLDYIRVERTLFGGSGASRK